VVQYLRLRHSKPLLILYHVHNCSDALHIVKHLVLTGIDVSKSGCTPRISYVGTGLAQTNIYLVAYFVHRCAEKLGARRKAFAAFLTSTFSCKMQRCHLKFGNRIEEQNLIIAN